MMTEEQAREKWCPAARVSASGLGNRYPFANDLTSASAFARCIASDCMWWRWGEAKTIRRGYCGMAGKP